MTPNWAKFQKVVNNMINRDLGAQECIIETPSTISYDFETGEIDGDPVIETIKTAIIPVNKDDLKDLPEGLREKVTRKLFTDIPLSRNAKITSVFDNVEFQVIIPSAPMTAGGLVHCYKTFIGKIENIVGED